MTCMTESRLEHLWSALKDYQKYCTVSNDLYSSLYQARNLMLVNDFPGRWARIWKKNLASWSNTLRRMWFRTFERKAQQITFLLGLVRAFNRKEPCDIDQDIDVKNWQLGSPEGKKSNLRVMSAELGRTDKEYSDLDKRVRDFITCQMPEEAMRYEDDIYVCLSSWSENFSYLIFCRFGGINVFLSHTSRRSIGQRWRTFCDATPISMVNPATIRKVGNYLSHFHHPYFYLNDFK